MRGEKTVLVGHRDTFRPLPVLLAFFDANVYNVHSNDYQRGMPECVQWPRIPRGWALFILTLDLKKLGSEVK